MSKSISKSRNFTVIGKGGKESGSFAGSTPRQAALKAANRSSGTKKKPATIKLRETGTDDIHVFKGWKERVKAPENKPAWMPEKINKANVKKIK